MSTRTTKVGFVAAGCLLGIVSAGCGLLPFFEDSPELCTPDDVDGRPCGICDQGRAFFRCQGDARTWVLEGDCEGDAYDLDGDGFANERCFLERAGDSCCGVPDCDDADPVRWQADHADAEGYADQDGDGHLSLGCGGDDCNDEDELRWSMNPGDSEGYADRDGDGHLHEGCCDSEGQCGDDCNDEDSLRWTGNADLDGDLHDDAACGGDDCNDDDPLRWTGHADLDGDGIDSRGCGGEDCLDHDVDRWEWGEVDRDGDGWVDVRCGGLDCDDGCDTCYPEAPAECDAARDHDCDGVVDELGGCGACVPGDLRGFAHFPETGVSRDVFVVGGGEYVFVASADGTYFISFPLLPIWTYIQGPAETGDSHAVFGVKPLWNTPHRYAYVASEHGVLLAGFGRGAYATRVHSVATGDTRALACSNFYCFAGGTHAVSAIEATAWPEHRVTYELAHDLMFDIRGLFARDGRLYVTSLDGRGMLVYQINEPPWHPAPRLEWAHAWAFEHGAMATEVFVTRTHVFFTVESGLWVAPVDLIDDTEWGWRAFWWGVEVGPGVARDVFVVGDFAYVVGDFGFQVVDVSEPMVPTLVGEPIDTGRSEGVFISAGHAFVASESGLYVIDLGCDKPDPDE